MSVMIGAQNDFVATFAKTIYDLFYLGDSWLYWILYFAMVVGFTFFYALVLFEQQKISETLRKHGGFIPGIRPGRPTQEYLDRVLTRITFAGALFLAVIGLVQYYIPQLTGIATFTLVGGTSLLIVVGVAQDTMQQLEAHLVMRNYEGFIKRGGPRRGGGGGNAGLSLQ